MKTLVTGATGLLGAHLIAYLLKQNKKIIATKRKGSNINITKKILSYYFSDGSVFEKIEWIEPDFFNPAELEEILNQHSIKEIYHCAGLVSFNDRRRNEILKTNVEITSNLVNVCLNTDIKFCYVSSVAALLNQFEHNNISEKTFWQAGKYEYAYALSKYLGECEVWRGIEEGLNAVIVNPGIIVGAGNWKSGWGILVRKAYKGIPFYTEGVMGYVAVEDVAEIMIQLMEKNIFGKRFILVENNYSYKEILEELHFSLSKPVPKYKAHRWMLELAGISESILNFIFPKYEPAFTKATIQGATMKNFYNNQLIKETLNYTFRSIKPYIHSVSKKFLEEKHQ
ncbi:MAG: NAD-dependent epimerase/dehydratase family protein [Bacteroidia bacterium]